jgi:hypothetical protein
LPVVPVFNYRTVNNMRFVAFLDTEEVAGSNPVVPTIFINNLGRISLGISTRNPPRNRYFASFLRVFRLSVLRFSASSSRLAAAA